ncbi:nucleoside hydrolase [Herbiconiux sp. P17]|uniref:nucleoside hydrolase n=1 Tax=Herbiconiux wuyangfengii TaxID=3342794 RepID=UPI0035B8137E
MATTAQAVYLDCDTGIDDAIALAFLLAVAEVDLVGVGTVSGNTSAQQAARNTLDLLAVAGRFDVPVAVGEHDWLTRAYDGGSPHVHGENGIGDLEIPRSPQVPLEDTAAELLIRLSHDHAGSLDVVAIGPLTNLARALEIDPALAGRIRQVTVMGGAASAAGNVTAVAEANIWHDPEAAQSVVSASWPVLLVPLDLTMEHVFDEHHQEQLLSSADPLARQVGRMLDRYLDFYVDVYGRRCSALHDPLAAAIAVGQVALTRAPAVPMEVDVTFGPSRGQTVVDLRRQRRGPVDHQGVTTRVALAIEADNIAPHLIEVLTSRRFRR